MDDCVVILTAGLGKRMGPIGQNLNKALLPAGQQAAISKIICQFSSSTEFVIAVGHLADQVRDYLTIAHPTTKFTFVHVENFDGPGSGPGQSLYACSDYLQRPFFFVSCDTIWSKKIHDIQKTNWIGVSKYTSEDTKDYCSIRTKGAEAIGLVDKSNVPKEQYVAFTGLCFIKDYEIFWRGLLSAKEIDGEIQISGGLLALIESDKTVHHLSIDWNDLGSLTQYNKYIRKNGFFDFGKTNECIYFENGKVIKFFAQSDISRKRAERGSQKPKVFPQITDSIGNFFAYDFQTGATLYNFTSVKMLPRLLSWLETDLWTPATVDKERMEAACQKFYFQKTQKRLATFHKKYPGFDKKMSINGSPTESATDLIKQLPWDSLASGEASFIHGDLQFDNIIFDEKTEAFKLIDWREDFGGEVEFGDKHYDLAKLYGGLIINYDLIKANLMTFSETKDEVWFDFGSRHGMSHAISLYENYLKCACYDLRKIKFMVAMIFINMSPLHHYPFDKLLICLARRMITELSSDS